MAVHAQFCWMLELWNIRKKKNVMTEQHWVSRWWKSKTVDWFSCDSITD